MPRQAKEPPEAKEQGEALSDSIRRALEAAAVATDAAEEASTVSDDSRKAIEAAIAGQRKLTAIAGGAFAAAVLSVGLAGLIYFRSTADLRIAAEIQAAANKAGIEQIKVLTETVGEAAKALTIVNAMKDDIGAKFDGLGSKIGEDLARVTAESATLQPQVAASIQDHVDQTVAAAKDDIMAALVEMQATAPAGGGVDPEMKQLLLELTARMAEMQAVAKPAPPPKAAQSQPAAKKTSSKKAKPRPTAPATNFSYP